MPKYTMPIPTRQEWQQLRDKNKVSKGAAKASIGDSIDAVQKTFALSTMSKHQQAVTQLGKDVDAYLVAIGKKYPAFVPIVTKQLKGKVRQHQGFVSDQIKAKSEYYPRYAAVTESVTKLKLHGEGKPKDVAKAMERLLGCAAAFALVDPAWDPKRQGLNRIMSECERADTLTAEHFKVIEALLNDLKP